MKTERGKKRDIVKITTNESANCLGEKERQNCLGIFSLREVRFTFHKFEIKNEVLMKMRIWHSRDVIP